MMKAKLSILFTLLVITTMLSAPFSDANRALASRGTPGTNIGTSETGLYIVLLSDPSLSSYTGGLPGLSATNPKVTGERKLDVKAPASVAYLDYLADRQAEFISEMEQALGRSVDAQYRYDAVLNGLAVQMSADEASIVASLPGVREVEPDFMRQIETDAGPTWIGAGGIWDGSATGTSSKGEGLIIGMIDTGINGDHPSFADPGPSDGYDYVNPLPAYLGDCAPPSPTYTCNDKLIGAYDMTTENNPEDANGHGSHTASTVAGNALNDIVVEFPTIDITRTISGVAPHAFIISYKACVPAGCPNSATNAAINQAVIDGVDAINYSIGGGPSNPWTDTNSLAFLDAREAGVFVAVSAGNSGPGAGTVGSPANSPWVTSVGNATHNRTFFNTISFSGGPGALGPFTGTSVTSGYGPAAIVHAGDYGDPLCGTPFPAGTWTGEIVVCDRGTYALVDKVANAAAGGAGGVVIANAAANGLATVAIPHVLPSTHLNYTDSQALRTWLSTGTGHMGTITSAVVSVDDTFGDRISPSSSRGPNSPVKDVMKPDVMAPGTDILAAYKTPEEFNMISGTSMASPHTAGASLLLLSLHPSWTPAMIQSALVSTAIDDVALKQDWVTPADPFDMGGGRVYASNAARAGFVLDETIANYQAANPGLGGDPSTLNLASLSKFECPGVCSWTRVVSSTQDTAVTWTTSVEAPAGMTLTVSPATFDLPAHGTQSIVVTANLSGLPLDQWAFARVQLTPSDDSLATAHFPISVYPVEGAPAISINPDSITTSQVVDTSRDYPLVISNLGSEQLTWSIFEDNAGGKLAPELVNWADNFDSYGTGVSLHGLGGWKGWGNDPTYTAYTSNAQALSTPNSVAITSSSDLVHEYSGSTSGKWIYTAWQFIPTGSTGESYFLLLNQYNDAGTTLNWSTQVNFNSDLNLVVSEGLSTDSLPMIRNQWVEIRVEIDLDNDLQRFYYGGDLLYEVSWTEGVSGGGILNIGAVDLYGNTGSVIYYDDISLVEDLTWSDNFDSYATDVSLHGLGGWKGWGNDPTYTAYTRDVQVHSAPNSVAITSSSDLVHEYAGYTSGVWYYTAWQYIPVGSTGESYFILLNQYDDAGTTNNWSTQVNFNSDLDLVISEGESTDSLPMIQGEWVQIVVEIDLVNDIQRFFYGGDMLYEVTWTNGVSGGGILNIGAVDLFGNTGSVVYYDDLSLSNIPPIEPVCDAPTDLPWVSVAPTSGTTDPLGSSTVAVTFDTTGLTVGDTYSGTLCVVSNDPANPVVPVPLAVTVLEDQPDIAVDPTTIDLTLESGASQDVAVTIANEGTLDLEVTDITGEPSWLTLSFTQTTVAPSAAQDLTLFIDATGLAAGTYTASLLIHSNDPDEATVQVDITLTVTVTEFKLFLPIVMKNP